MTRKPVFIGIDVAFAKRKRLPVCVCTWQDGRLVPAALRGLPLKPPRGKGNRATLDEDAVTAFADAAAEYVEGACDALGLEPRRIALDAPSAPRPDEVGRRAAEMALDGAGISCFATPSMSELEGIRAKVTRHLAEGGAENRMPHANQLWMIVGFALFRRLERLAPCIEVFPQATAHALGAADVHKFRAGGVDAQLAATSRYTGWPYGNDPEPAFREIAFGPAHDRLDAYLSAWVAALDEHDRMGLGDPPDDVIWVPELRGVQFEPGRPGAEAREAKRATRAAARPSASGAPVEAEASDEHRRWCPACGEHQFKRWPFGWDAHAAHTCGGLHSPKRSPEAGVQEAVRASFRWRDTALRHPWPWPDVTRTCPERARGALSTAASEKTGRHCGICGLRWSHDNLYYCLDCGTAFGICCRERLKRLPENITLYLHGIGAFSHYRCPCGGREG